VLLTLLISKTGVSIDKPFYELLRSVKLRHNRQFAALQQRTIHLTLIDCILIVFQASSLQYDRRSGVAWSHRDDKLCPSNATSARELIVVDQNG
jgi:hypothetical protein